jgi:hypothetical protein
MSLFSMYHTIILINKVEYAGILIKNDKTIS